ncbi:helix-turn-helix transcriptional regulator [Streptomyces sp. NPDC052682]|uniref:helix-turn-helix transcriptional regulator n=1 Tax=Streptomyces sp. NPDC052682 TaxID=3154954 RepID=UPI0034245CF7
MSVEICDEGVEHYREALAQGRLWGHVPECLVAWGLIQPVPEETGVFLPVPPDIASAALIQPLEQSILTQRHAVIAVRSAMSRVEGIHQALRLRGAEPTRLLADRTMAAVAVREAVRTCKEELLTFQPNVELSVGTPLDVFSAEPPPALAGVHRRSLYQHSARSHGPSLARLEREAEAAEIRTIDEVLGHLMICDRSIAFMSVPQDRRTAVLVIQQAHVVSLLVMLFEYIWDRARPMDTAGRPGPGLLTHEVQTAVLRLMVSGHTDEMIATRLGISTRTVYMHIKKIANLLGSRSRAQLGYLVARAGLLDDATRDDSRQVLAGPGAEGPGVVHAP